ncbi:unnamed protein product [Eruca vesicaria subsp. sativa]|uniref:Uncharacterized protein n=1 Tax=Eruca vesicaria subsp. sativa TaxID=29727 RepID=A0ABC8IYX7_ERUVS|nr:unnamed protein product [Eruca vesicaria subsp. sativa]
MCRSPLPATDHGTGTDASCSFPATALGKPNHVSKPEEEENQCGKAGDGHVLTMLKSFWFMVNGIVKDDVVEVSEFAKQGMPVVEIATLIFEEVLGRTLSRWPLLSSRRHFRRIVWHRVRHILFLLLDFNNCSWLMYQEDSNKEWIVVWWQIKQLNEPTDVMKSEWNTEGLLTRIEA